MQADAVDFGRFWNFMWTRQRELWRFLLWVGEMDSRQGLANAGLTFASPSDRRPRPGIKRRGRSRAAIDDAGRRSGWLT